MDKCLKQKAVLINIKAKLNNIYSTFSSVPIGLNWGGDIALFRAHFENEVMKLKLPIYFDSPADVARSWVNLSPLRSLLAMTFNQTF